MPRRPNLRQTASSQAAAEYDPQIQGVRRSTRQQVRSVRSSGPALEASLDRAGQQLRHSNLDPRDLAIALRELAYRNADVGSSVALQTQQIQDQGQGELTDLLAARGSAERSILGQLQQAQAEHAQERRDAAQDDTRSFKMDILKEMALQKLGLGQYADDGGDGLTPTQERARKEEHDNAAFFAKQYFQASKGGVTDEDGKVLIPPNPKGWDDTTWNALVEKVAAQEGVDSVEAAQRAVGAIRDHVQPGHDATSSDLLRTLGSVAATAGAAVAPKPLQPIAQFGAMLARPRY